MHYKIYFENKPVFLIDTIGDELSGNLDKENILFVNEFSTTILKETIESIQTINTDAVIFFHKNLDELKNAFWKQFTVIQAAGGLVFNENDDVLCIHRRGKWDLPKGKLDPGESLQECAVREVEEETGLQNIHLQNFLHASYHTYKQDGEHILKETFWYEMTAKSTYKLVAQADEDILEAKWIKNQNLHEIVESTYPSIKDVFESYFRIMSK